MLPKFSNEVSASAPSIRFLFRFDRQISIYNHRDLTQRAAARLERLQPRIDRLDRAVDSLADMRHYQALHRPLIARVMPRCRKAFASSSRVAGSEK